MIVVIRKRRNCVIFSVLWKIEKKCRADWWESAYFSWEINEAMQLTVGNCSQIPFTSGKQSQFCQKEEIIHAWCFCNFFGQPSMTESSTVYSLAKFCFSWNTSSRLWSVLAVHSAKNIGKQFDFWSSSCGSYTLCTQEMIQKYNKDLHLIFFLSLGQRLLLQKRKKRA